MAIYLDRDERRLPILIIVYGKTVPITMVDYTMYGPDARVCTSMFIDEDAEGLGRRILVSANHTLAEQARSVAYVVLRAEMYYRDEPVPESESFCRMANILGDLIEANICR